MELEHRIFKLELPCQSAELNLGSCSYHGTHKYHANSTVYRLCITHHDIITDYPSTYTATIVAAQRGSVEQ